MLKIIERNFTDRLHPLEEQMVKDDTRLIFYTFSVSSVSIINYFKLLLCVSPSTLFKKKTPKIG